MNRYVTAVLGGLFATLVMDVGSMLVRATGFTAGAPPKVIGKWFMYALRGQVIHADIAASPDIPVRMPLVLAIHYSIGIALACTFAALASALALQRSMFALAVGFGALTTVLAWFLMFPAMGWGIAGTAGPDDLLLARTSLVNHAVYGLGLAVWMTLVAPRLMRRS